MRHTVQKKNPRLCLSSFKDICSVYFLLIPTKFTATLYPHVQLSLVLSYLLLTPFRRFGAMVRSRRGILTFTSKTIPKGIGLLLFVSVIIISFQRIYMETTGIPVTVSTKKPESNQGKRYIRNIRDSHCQWKL